MIESIVISGVATYGDQPEVLDGLSQFNFVFGSNGTGKTTISRVIAEAADHEHCQVSWKSGTKLQAIVYNRDFVDSNFNQSTEIKGVFTLGEKDVDTLNNIINAKKEIDGLIGEIENLNKTLKGNDGEGGKLGELKVLESAINDKCWAQKKKHDAKLQGAFKGFRDKADKFKVKILQERDTNTATLATLESLEQRSGTIFGEAPTQENLVQVINADRLITYETDTVLRKRVLGREDVDIAAMIKKLDNSDWVKQGRVFYDINDMACPFCQQATTNDFAKSLNEYFDETFVAESKAIDDLATNYQMDAERLQQAIAAIITAPSRFLGIETLKLEKQLLDSKLSGNLQSLSAKKKEPGQVVGLDSTSSVVSTIQKLVDDANVLITEHNTMVGNLSQERQTLTSQVWKYLLEVELKADLNDYIKKKNGLNAAISSLNGQISTKSSEKIQKEQEIRQLEKRTTSIQPTIDGINALLSSFGFHGFSLAKAGGDRFYKLVRPNGVDAKATLSEGERTFVTFLYFYHLLKGSNSESGITNNRVVVFDDPVSSLDSDVLFIVSSLIKGLFEDVRAGVGYIKQIFVLTHNVYFHKEVTFNPNRTNGVMNEETFWIIRKSGLLSKAEKQTTNPIKTSYELLWAEVKKPDVSSLTIQNTLRRILENYFKILGGIDPDKICAMFDGKNKLICKSLFSWVNDGSHSVHDDLYVSNADTTIEAYLQIFKEIFEKSKHVAHYNMMMGGALAEVENE